MDMIYRRYSNPSEFMNLYIENGQFGDFVSNVIDAENKEKKEKAKKDNDDRLWNAYIHSYSEQTFAEWKKGLKVQKKNENKPTNLSMTNKEVDKAKENARGILSRISPVIKY